MAWNRSFPAMIAIIATLVVIFAAPVSASGAPPAEPIHVSVDGYDLGFDTAPRIERGRALVPWRWLLEYYGFDVHYDAETSKIVTWGKNRRIEMQIGASAAVVNGQTVSLDVPPQVFSGRTLVPLRFVSEALGYTVDWNEAERIVTITGHGQSAPPLPGLDGVRSVERGSTRPDRTVYRTLSASDPADSGYLTELADAWRAAAPAVHPAMDMPMPPYGYNMHIQTAAGTISVFVAWDCTTDEDGRSCTHNEQGYVYLWAAGAEPVLARAPGLARFILDFPAAE